MSTNIAKAGFLLPGQWVQEMSGQAMPDGEGLEAGVVCVCVCVSLSPCVCTCICTHAHKGEFLVDPALREEPKVER